MENDIKKLIGDYDSVVKVVDGGASDADDRSYGGFIRAAKGKLQEYLTARMAAIAWATLGGAPERLAINSAKQPIPIKDEYITRLPDEQVRRHILAHKDQHVYKLSVDKQVFVDGDLAAGIECKAYTENAMIKEILVDFSLLKTLHPRMACFLFQLESQLGGDYSQLRTVTYGSPSTHTLMSYFPTVDLHIVTLLAGERNIEKPIHKKGHFKPLQAGRVRAAIARLQEALKPYL